MRQRKKYVFVSLAVFLLNFLLDRVTKILAAANLKGKMPLRFFNDIFILVYAENDGAFLSLGANWNIYVKYLVLLIIPICVCAAIMFYAMVRENRMRTVVIASCIAGGGISNLVDRLFNGFSVIDFMNFGFGGFRTGILNVADLSVTFGVILLTLGMFEKKNRA
jgi:signal peptidase II